MNYYIIIRGPLGSGKSTIAGLLSKKLNAKHFSVDIVLDKHKLTKDKEAGYISQKSFIMANEIIAPKAKMVLKKGIPVIFEGNFYWKSQIDDLVKRLNFPHYIFTLQASLKVCLERDKMRNNPHGEDATKAVYKKAIEFSYGSVIDTTKPLNESVKEIISYLPKS